MDLPPELLRPHRELRPTWYQIVYNLAAHHAHRGLRAREVAEQEQQYRKASQFATLMASSAAITLLAFGQEEMWRLSRARLLRAGFGRQRNLARFLQETGEPSAIVIAAAVAPFAGLGSELRPRDWESTRRAAELGSRQALLAVIDRARSASSAEAGQAARVLIECVERRPLSYRSFYNLACYFTRQRRFDDALYYLGRSLIRADPMERRGLQRAVWRDPSLAPLIEARHAAVVALVSSAIPVDEVTGFVERQRSVDVEAAAGQEVDPKS